MMVRSIAFLMLSLLACAGGSRDHTSVSLPSGPTPAPLQKRLSGDVAELREIMSTGADPGELTNRFRIVQSWHSDYFGPPDEIGGDATSVMNWFFADDGLIYRVNYDGRVVPLRDAPNWIKDMRPANQQVDGTR